MNLNLHGWRCRRRHLNSSIVFAVAATVLVPFFAQADVVISEIYYHPASENVLEEYIELLNTGPEAVSLNGWQFSDGISFVFPDITLASGERIVVASDVATFTALHPGVSNVIGNWSGQLSNSDEDIDLDDAAGDRVDSVDYADDGDWADRRRGTLDYGHRGWDWFALHDGGGRSLELVNPALSNNHGQNWRSSLVDGGTPGMANSVEQSNVAPLILEVQHLPAIPRSIDDVLVMARLVDELAGGVTASVKWRVDGAPGFSSATMYDDGLHDDGGAGDGVYAAVIPAQAADTVVEFYVEASDQGANTRTWPAAALDTDGITVLGQVANALYQVDDSTYEGAQPLYKIIMLEAERAELEEIGDDSASESRTSAKMNTTFISIDAAGIDVRYTVGTRNRGEGSRYRQPNSYRVNFNGDHRWKGVKGLNINGQYTHVQILGSVLALKSGVLSGESRPVQIRVNNANLGNNGPQTFGSVYAANEVVNTDWAEHWLPGNSSGNAYRVKRYDTPDEFNYRGENPNAYTNTYFKATNESEDDWTDLIAMLRIVGTNDQFTVANIDAVVDVKEWMAYLAVNALVNNRETSPNTGHNDDYFLYGGVNDPRFRLITHDFDTILGQGDTYGSRSGTIFGAFGEGNDSAFDLSPLFDHPEYEALYYQTMQLLLDTTFSKPEFDATVIQTLGAFVPQSTLESMIAWMDVRREYVQGVIAPYLANLDIAPTATVSGEPRSPTPQTGAVLTVGGEGVTQYRYALNGSGFGPATPVATPITLSTLPNGSSNTVQVIGAGADNVWQAIADATVSRSWVVDTSLPTVRINEVLASNETAYNHYGTFPDVVELYNEGDQAVDLTGMRLSDRPDSPNKFSFPEGTTLDPDAYLAVLANDSDGTPGFHTDFSLNADGEGVYLFDSVVSGGALLDQVEYGLQLTDFSFGRIDSGSFVLTQPTPGSENVAVATAPVGNLCINEWLTRGFLVVTEDFVELYNPEQQPVNLGGLYLTDNPIGDPTRHRIAPLSFIGSADHRVFKADGDAAKGADHLDFRLSSEQGLIALLDQSLEVIDSIAYGPQKTDISQGRAPDAAESFAFFTPPTPDAPNPASVAAVQITETAVEMTDSWRYYQLGSLDGMDWTDPSYNDSGWPEGPALLYYESADLPEAKNTQLNLNLSGGGQVMTYYFRTHFSFTNDPASAALELTAVIDDACVVYLNGEPVYWLGFPDGSSPVYSDAADRVVNNAVVEGPYPLPVSALVQGDNVLAVEVHQQSPTSSDVCFGLRLDAVSSPASDAMPLALSEVFASNASYTNDAGFTPDWVELVNTGTNVLDLGDMSLSDDPGLPRKWIFPGGTLLAPGARLVIECDASQPASPSNTGFGLANDGDALLLYDAPAQGGGNLDSVAFGPQVADYSIARLSGGGGEWTLALPTRGAANVAAGLGNEALLRINEWMAIPQSGDDWFELYNPNPLPVDLQGLALTDDPGQRGKSPFPSLSFIGPAGFLEMKADDNPGAGATHVDFNLVGSGDFVGLYRATSGIQIDDALFGPQAAGVSQGLFPDGSAGYFDFPDTPSPGEPNYYPLDHLVISELLSHTDPPLEDAVEIQNQGSASIDISGWYLSDSARQLKKFRVPDGTTVPPGGYTVLYEYQFVTNGLPGVVEPFSFNSAHGGQVYLSETDDSSTLTGYRAAAEFGASQNGVSFGRFETTAGIEFTAMSRRTFGSDNPGSLAEFRLGTGSENAYPLVGPVVFSELNYQPDEGYAGSTNAGQYIELYNTDAAPHPLYDPAYPTNSWHIGGGVAFTFPAGAAVPARGTVLVVGFNPDTDTAQATWFRNHYEVPPGVPLFGPWSGSLDADGETLRMYRPDTPQQPPSPEAGFVPQILVEQVDYMDSAPWPTNGIGSGATLQRFAADGFGNEPGNWFAASASGGRDNLADRDGDGLPDYWEVENGLDPDVGSGVDGAGGNLDGDPMTNLEEWRAGTRADDSADYLRILSFEVSPVAVNVEFMASPARRYVLLGSDTLTNGVWQVQAEAPLTANSTLMQIYAPRTTNDMFKYYGLEATTEIVP